MTTQTENLLKEKFEVTSDPYKKAVPSTQLSYEDTKNELLIFKVKQLSNDLESSITEYSPENIYTLLDQEQSTINKLTPAQIQEFQKKSKELENLTHFIKNDNEKIDLLKIKKIIDRFKPKYDLKFSGKNIEKFNKILPSLIEKITIKENDGGATKDDSKMAYCEISIKNPFVEKNGQIQYAFKDLKPFVTKVKDDKKPKNYKDFDYIDVHLGYEDEMEYFGRYYLEIPVFSFPENGAATITLKALSCEINLIDKNREFVWRNKTREEIVETIAKDAGLGVDIENTNTPKKTIVQLTNDYQFIKTMAKDIGYVFYIERNILHFHSMKETDISFKTGKFYGYNLNYRPNSKGTLKSFKITSFEIQKWTKIVSNIIKDNGQIETKEFDVYNESEVLSKLQDSNNSANVGIDIGNTDNLSKTFNYNTQTSGISSKDSKIKSSNDIDDDLEEKTSEELFELYKKYCSLYDNDPMLLEYENYKILSQETRLFYLTALKKYYSGELSENDISIALETSRKEVYENFKSIIAIGYSGSTNEGSIYAPGVGDFIIPENVYNAGQYNSTQRYSISAAITNEIELEKILKAKAIKQRFVVKATGNTIGLPKLRARRVVNILGVDVYSQKYYITDATHTYDSNGYNVTFNCVSIGRKFPKPELNDILENEENNKINPTTEGTYIQTKDENNLSKIVNYDDN